MMPRMLIDPPVPLPSTAVRVEWDNTASGGSAAAADFIERRWRTYQAEAVAGGRTLFNGAVTRLIAASLNDGGKGEVHLRLGPTDYKTFLVTCMRDAAWFRANAPEAVTPALGNSALLTRGGRALLGIRSHRVSAYPGHAHLFGGVAELLGTEKFPASAAGLVAHLELELHEEAGVSRAELAPGGPRVLGLAFDEFLQQPELFWQWETGIELDEIAARLNAEEHSGAVIVTRGEPEAVGVPLTPVARHVIGKWSLRT